MQQAEEAALLRAKGTKDAAGQGARRPAAPIDEPAAESDAPSEGKAPRPGRGPDRR